MADTITDQIEDKVSVRIATTAAEIEASQRLRYAVFYEEQNAVADEKMSVLKMDFDEYDAVMDHLIVLDDSLPKDERIVGTYRMMRREVADKFGKFYTDSEFDISPLLNSGAELLELGRSCVLAPYRTRPVLQKLWEGIAHYVAEYNIGLMFGCASIPGTDPQAVAEQLSYLYHYHLAAPELRPRALESRYIEMNLIPKENIDAKRVFASLPPLVKGYLRLGASIGEGAIIDYQWGSIDVCIVMPTHLVTDKYLKHYQRKTNGGIRIDNSFADRVPAKVTS
ncbi:MAG: hemolysin-like protein [Micavibrio aeruginosavorus]|uniref:Hemolysin-like protein n=1 Tax=Micavibrio aeruginosavorus TaxID=349221 RepID=A0A2W5MV00_9BACT|nr:MAG: hemolysin-like protein [Micavibrio aeruginosavorus]